jgi:hypothetical protein
MRIGFAPLATVTAAHGYYSEACRDIEFLPSGGTRALLQAGRILSRVLNGQLHLLFEAEDIGIPISSLAGKTLHFGLRISNGYFANVTKPVLAGTGLVPHYSNATDAVALDAPQGAAMVAGLYTHTPASVIRPVTLTLFNSAGNTLDTRVENGPTTSYDLRALIPGEYRIEENYGSGPAETRRLFLDATLSDAGVWGVLSLRIDPSFYTSAPNFNLTFAARTETLRYYVVASNWQTEEFDQLNISDDGFVGDNRDKILFTKTSPPFPDGFIQESLLGDGNAKIVAFQSQTEVARRERGLKKLRLNRNATVLIEHLPLPGPERAKAELIIRLSKP